MRLPLLGTLLGSLVVSLISISHATAHESNLTYFGAPRFSIEGVLPVLDIAESYIRSQSDGSVKQIGAKGDGRCSANNPCILGSCCNSDGQCGYRTDHCSPSHPKTCVANCDAKAPCGKFSNDSKSICPLNACCSRLGFCGTSDVFCRNTASKAGNEPCLGGNCGAIDAPSCGKNSGTASRRVAYFQSWNSRRRPCDKVLPSQLDLTGITHLVLSFATIDPTTFKVGLMNPDDDDIYKQFMALPDNVSKWIGIGGYEFTDAGPTQHTWSDMSASQQNRKAFIESLKDFCSKWGFKGVDIDWEWPGHESRGGRPGDAANQVQLVKEMRQALGSGIGIGVVVPAKYDYMKNLDPKGLESYVDMMTMLTYDLHGAWDMTIPGLGPKIKPHTDLKEIDEAFKLLWSSNIEAKKVNMGIANYGRGYTVADKNCMHYGCTYSGPSKAGSCTRQDGVLSLCEIHRIMDERQLTSRVISGGAEANEITWDDQWISFDDAGTFGKKLELANDRCLGGTALWAIDYATCPGGGGSPPGPGSSAPPAPSSIAPPSSIASINPTRSPSEPPAQSQNSEKPPSTSGPAVSVAPSIVSSDRPSGAPPKPPASSLVAPSFVESSWTPQSSTTASGSWSTTPPEPSSFAPVPSAASSDRPSKPPASSAPASSSSWTQPSATTVSDSKSNAPSSKPWAAPPSSAPWSAPSSSVAGSALSSSAPASLQSSSASPPSSSDGTTVVPVPVPTRSSGTSSGWFSSPASSQGFSSAQPWSSSAWSSHNTAPSPPPQSWAWSSAVKPSGILTTWSASNAAPSSAWSPPHSLPAGSSQNSAPAASGTFSLPSGPTMTLLSSSAARTSAIPTLPTAIAPVSWEPPNAPSSRSSVVASVINSLSFSAPAATLPHPPLPTYVWCPGPCQLHDWCRRWCSEIITCPIPQECMVLDWCYEWWAPCHGVSAPPSTTTQQLPSGQRPPTPATITHPPLPTYVWCPENCWQHDWCVYWCHNVLACPAPIECLLLDWCYMWWAACDPKIPAIGPSSTSAAIAPAPAVIWCPDACWGLPWCLPLCKRVISCPAPPECLLISWCRDWFAFCHADPLMPLPGVTIGTNSIVSGTSQGTNGPGATQSGPSSLGATQSGTNGPGQSSTNAPGATQSGTTGPGGSQSSTDAPSTTAASATTASVSATTSSAGPSATSGAEIWCPDDCKSLDWCNKWCKAPLDDHAPQQCWDFDWCMLWWGWPKVKGSFGVDKDKPQPECKLLGCGCGWMGLPFGPGCPPMPWILNLFLEIFGLFPEPCSLFGCDGLCGTLGCDGWCFTKGGCTECPWPLCHDFKPKIGPPPFPFPFKPPKLPKPGKPDPNHPDPNHPDPTKPDGPDTPEVPAPCKPEEYKTVTERFVYCGEFVDVSSGVSVTTFSSWISTTASTTTSSTSTCTTVLDLTQIGCNLIDDKFTTTVKSTTTHSLNISSETPGPACTRAPLSLDDDEGNNIPVDWNASSSSFGANMTDFSSLMSKSSASPTSSSSPTPSADCGACWKVFDETCVKKHCSPNDPKWCAYQCFSDMCHAPNFPKQCAVGNQCAHKGCSDKTGEPPKEDLTLTLTFSSTTATVTMPSGSTYLTSHSPTSSFSTSFEGGTGISTSSAAKPTPTDYGGMDKNGEWRVHVHLWSQDKRSAKIEWELFDPNKNQAGSSSMMPMDPHEDDSIFTYIESSNRPDKHMMPFGVKAYFEHPLQEDEATVVFEIQKDMSSCDRFQGQSCKPKMVTENRIETKAFFIDTCWKYCKNDKDRKMLPSDMGCDDLNDNDWFKDGNAWRRDFYCYWRGY